MAVALTGDAATQKETFDVPVVARGTFLGEHRWSGKEAGQGPRSQVRFRPAVDRAVGDQGLAGTR